MEFGSKSVVKFDKKASQNSSETGDLNSDLTFRLNWADFQRGDLNPNAVPTPQNKRSPNPTPVAQESRRFLGKTDRKVGKWDAELPTQPNILCLLLAPHPDEGGGK